MSEGPEERDTEEGGILRRKTDRGSENTENKIWGVGSMRDGKTQGKIGLLAISKLPSLALCTKEVATVKETRWIGASLEGHFDRNVSRVKQEPSLYLKGFYNIREFMPHLLSRTPTLSVNTLTWHSINRRLWAATSYFPEDPRAVNLRPEGLGSLPLH